MKKTLIVLALAGASAAARGQFQVNPQMGLTYQHLSSDQPNVEFRGAVGWQLGTDFRIGNRAYIQPGVFFGRNTTAVKTSLNDSIVAEGDIVRTNLRLKMLGGYRIVDTYQFDLRFFAGPTYDVLLSVDDKDDEIGWNEGDFNRGSFNIDAGLGFDMGLFTLEPSVSFGIEPRVQRQPHGEGHRLEVPHLRTHRRPQFWERRQERLITKIRKREPRLKGWGSSFSGMRSADSADGADERRRGSTSRHLRTARESVLTAPSADDQPDTSL
ncbi:MAG: outer membrane beta-barrel protein [Flavobacteriales bacterium]|nr:outer membrane beta-barrel protein [Flavobacteriales bacterium]